MGIRRANRPSIRFVIYRGSVSKILSSRKRIAAQDYQVKEMLGSGADGGVDLLLRQDRSDVVVQCKRWIRQT